MSGSESGRPGGAPGAHPALPVLPADAVAEGQPRRDSGAGRSILERRVTLAELVDVRSFRDLCASFVDLYKIGIKVFDNEGTKLVDIRVGNGDWCGYIFSNPTGRRECTALVQKVKAHRYPELDAGGLVEQACFSGLQYVIMPITYGGDALGRVIYGPYLPAEIDRPGAAVEAFPEGFDARRLWSYGDKIRRVSNDTITKIVDNFRRTLETVISIAFKALMTQHLHLESISASYEDLAETNRRLRSSVEKLKEMDRLKASFLAMISHELRTPLTSIIGYSEMLAEGMAGEMNPEQTEFVTTIREKGESLLGLIGSLLDISKIEAGAVQLNLREMKIEDVVRSAARTLVPQAQKKGVKLQVQLEPGLGAIIADYEKVNQSMINLLANAVKFTPEGGSVGLRAYVYEGERRYSGSTGRFGAAEERFLRIDISDTGIGIPKDKLADVFKAFYQVDNSFTREYGGTGLGLAIVKSFVEAHKGEVWVDSEPQKGTTFSLLFPTDLDEKEPSAIQFTQDL